MSLNRGQRIGARHRAVVAAELCLANAPAVHYTQMSPARWQGIHNHLIAARGEYPRFADCSSFVTWCLWNGLNTGGLHTPDVVNGQNWQAGYTGTMEQHGIVIKPQYAQPGDAVLYGHPSYHTAIIIGWKDGTPLAISHGEESGPYVVKWDAWGDAVIRRYIHDKTPQG